ncbi:hypothetical protein ACIHFE_32800 [Streptomyces sp. NPDC052396]|uniref:hypothetical protein n=1 Tax=Streptomyces sp. NPDC052396 TaxID=3365689 RepID=UPI0037D9673E
MGVGLGAVLSRVAVRPAEDRVGPGRGRGPEQREARDVAVDRMGLVAVARTLATAVEPVVLHAL